MKHAPVASWTEAQSKRKLKGSEPEAESRATIRGGRLITEDRSQEGGLSLGVLRNWADVAPAIEGSGEVR